MEVWQHYMHWNQVWNDAKSSKQHKYSMLEGLRHKASEGHYTRGIQYMAQMTKPAMDRAQLGQNKDQNMLKWELRGLGMHAYKLGHKQGNNGWPLEALKGWKKWEHGNSLCTEMSC